MPPRAKKAVAAAPADLADKKPANADSGGLDALREEVAAEAPTPAPDDETWPRSIPVGDVTVRVRHYLDWTLDSEEYIAAVDIRRWAEDNLAGDDFLTVWKPSKPTFRQGLKFIKDVEVAVGVPFAPHLDSLTT